MKGILLGGGLGTRLYPVTRILNKHAVLVYDRPMFFLPLKTLIDSGISEIAIVCGPPFGRQLKKLIQYFPKNNKVKINFVLQESPGGMPDAIYKCKKFAGRDNVFVISGDNFYEKDFKKEINLFNSGAMSFVRKSDEPERYGVAYFKNGKVEKIVEKPKNPTSNWVVTGPHIFDKKVFSYIEKLEPSERGELEISDLNMMYHNEGALKLGKRKDYWQDMGTFEGLSEVSNFIKEMNR